MCMSNWEAILKAVAEETTACWRWFRTCGAVSLAAQMLLSGRQERRRESGVFAHGRSRSKGLDMSSRCSCRIGRGRPVKAAGLHWRQQSGVLGCSEALRRSAIPAWCLSPWQVISGKRLQVSWIQAAPASVP